MKDALACVGARIDDHAKSGVGNSVFARQARRDLEDLTDERVIIGFDIEHARDVLSWNEKNMHRRLRLDVPERNDTIVLIDDIGVDLSFDKRAKKTAVHRMLLKTMCD
jgi:hypothetical protein